VTKSTKKDPYDRTSSKRQRAYLDEMALNGGKTVRLDLSAEDIKKLDELVKHKQSPSRVACLRDFIRAAHQRMPKAAKKDSGESS
jgi:hypothetical protein